MIDQSEDSPLDNRPIKNPLGNSTMNNAVMDGQITAGSRASKYIGMTAKQLDNARSGSKGLMTSTTTPKASRVSMGGTTPARSGRQSLGGSFATPKARGPRPSTAMDVMPPPPSPGKIHRVMGYQAQIEEEIRELKRRNASLEEELRGFSEDKERQRIQALQGEVDRVKEEADSLRQQLSASQADAADASRLAEELQHARGGVEAEMSSYERQITELKKEMQLAAERSAGELEAGMDARRKEVRMMQTRAEQAEAECGEMRSLTDSLTEAGQVRRRIGSTDTIRLL